MPFFASQVTRWPLWLALIAGWGVLAVLNSLLALLRDEPISQIVTMSFSVFIVGIVNTLIQTKFANRINVFGRNARWAWIIHIVLSLVFGLISALIVLSILGIYFLAMAYTKHFVFFSIYLYPNWLMFSLVHGLAIAISSVSAYYNRLRTEKDKNFDIALRLKESQLHTLSSNLNPHFLFNSLNNIRSLILEDKEKARSMLTNLSEILRHSLKASENEIISLAEELNIVRRFVELSAIQYEDRLQYSENILAEEETTKIPPMLLQLMVENAIKHGIDSNKHGGKIQVNIHSKAEKLMIEIRNPRSTRQNIPVEEREYPPIGIENIKNRLRLLYNDSAGFNLLELEDEVVCRVAIPMSTSDV